MKVDTFDLIRIFTSFQLVLFCIFLLIYNKHKTRSRILSLLLFTQACYIISGIFNGLNTYLHPNYLPVFYTIYSFTYLLGPSIYFYVLYFIDKSFSLSKKHLIHFVLFLFFLLSNLSYLHIPSTDIYLFNSQLSYTPLTASAIFILHFQIIGYLLYSIFILKKYWQNTANISSSPTEKSRYNWLQFLIFGFLSIWIIESLVYLTYTYYYILLCQVKVVLAILQFIIANFIVLQGLRLPELFNGEPSKSKYQKNVIKESDRDKYLSKLLEYMEKEAPYLDPLLNLNVLAEKTGIPPHNISQLLNTVLQKSFYDFVNEYRIEASKKFLLSNNSHEKTILEVMYDAGFSSKSVFNKAFKKHTGLTPKEFRIQNSSI